MVVVNAIAETPLTPALGKGRQQEHANRSIADIGEVYKREMFNIEESKIKRTIVEYGATKVGLGVSPPGNTCILKKLRQMLVCEYLRLARLRIPEDAEVGPCFQPQIIRLAGMVARRIEILLGVRRCLQQCPVGVRG